MRLMAHALLLCLAFPMAACETAQAPRSGAPASAAAAFQPSPQFVGTWTGATESGGAIAIVVPANGNPSYSFRGSPVRVNSARMEGDRLVLSAGSGGGTVVLTPAADGQLQYNYRFGSDTATALLTRR